jgi:hypothetical protein
MNQARWKGFGGTVLSCLVSPLGRSRDPNIEVFRARFLIVPI